MGSVDTWKEKLNQEKLKMGKQPGWEFWTPAHWQIVNQAVFVGEATALWERQSGRYGKQAGERHRKYACRDIPDGLVLALFAQYRRWQKTLPVREYLAKENPFVALCRLFPQRLVESKLLDLDRKGYLNYGVSVGHCWLEPEGEAALLRKDTSTRKNSQGFSPGYCIFNGPVVLCKQTQQDDK